MNYERVKAVFLKLISEKEATPYIGYIKAAISFAQSRIRPEYLENIPDCVYMYAAACALQMYTNAGCAGDITVCSENGTALINKDTGNIRKAAADYADYCLSLCRDYLKDDKFVMISTKRTGEDQ
ncbi:MAG: hypothetical protein ACI4JN_10245 [Ruminococcus sp.]